MKLSPKAFDVLHQGIQEIYSYRTLTDFREALPQILLRAIPADHFAYHACTLGPNPRFVTFEESQPCFTTPETLTSWEASMAEHPFTRYYLKTGDPSALRLSDFVSQAQLEKLTVYQKTLAPLDVRYLLSVATVASRGLVGGLSFCSGSRDFTEEHGTILNLLRPHVAQARRHAENLHALLAERIVPSENEMRDRAVELTNREREVGHWVAMGKTNGEIALLLSASRRTIEKHVERILNKLGAENRTCAAMMLLALMQ